MWEEKCAEFDDYDGMTETTSAFYYWQHNQLTGFDGKIKKEISANEGSTLWRDRRAKLVACIAKKKDDEWEEKYTEFDDYDGMPETTSVLYNWQHNQLTRFDGKIKKEIAANKGITLWRDRRAKLVACIAKTKDDEWWEEKYAEFDDYDGMTKS